jgi:thioredoxin reductase
MLRIGRSRRRQRPSLPQPQPLRLPVINAETCIGCSACVDACPYDVLEIKRYVAVVTRPDDCCGLTLCEQRCPNGSLVVKLGSQNPAPSLVTEDLESRDVPGLFLAGDVTGQPLIRNAIEQGQRAVAAIHKRSRPRAIGGSRDTFDLIIIGAGPAGLSAAIEAKRRGLRATILEQGSIAEGIRSFPRGKIVLDAGAEVAEADAGLWIGECTKEELLRKWQRSVRKHGINVREGQRVTSAARAPADGCFDVSALLTDGGQVRYRSDSILVCIGRRGTPRKLDAEIPETMQDRVHYALSNATSFRGERVLVVGLGDTAMEAAIALSAQAGTHVTVSYRGPAFRRGKQRNIETLRNLVRQGKIDMRFSSEVTCVDRGRVILRNVSDGSLKNCEIDRVFVLIGSFAAWGFLEALGLRRRDAQT